MRQASIEPAIHNSTGRHTYVCARPGCRALVTLVDWRREWEAYYQAIEQRKEQQKFSKTFGQVA